MIDCLWDWSSSTVFVELYAVIIIMIVIKVWWHLLYIFITSISHKTVFLDNRKCHRVWQQLLRATGQVSKRKDGRGDYRGIQKGEIAKKKKKDYYYIYIDIYDNCLWNF